MSDPSIQNWSLFQRTTATPPPPAPAPNATWRFASPGATALVYYANGRARLERPVILSDGFNSGPSDFDAFWHELNGREFPFATELRKRGYDLVLLGYDERSASLLENAVSARNCIARAIAERTGNAPLVVGGFSMGGIITRLALAELEAMRIHHETALYVSFDSPHRGAWIPISLQAFAHLGGKDSPLSKQINSPAARELLWRHISEVNGTPAEDPMRTALLSRLEMLGGWPAQPRKIGVANGQGQDLDNGIPKGSQKALEVTAGPYKGTTLYTQASGDALVAKLVKLGVVTEVRTKNLPEVDRAPGGKLASFGIAADNLNAQAGTTIATAYHPEICFVPTISAVSVLDIDPSNIYSGASVLLDSSDFDDFRCSSKNTMHAQMTAELGQWILQQLQ